MCHIKLKSLELKRVKSYFAKIELTLGLFIIKSVLQIRKIFMQQVISIMQQVISKINEIINCFPSFFACFC